MFDIRSHRSSDSGVHAQRATPVGVRYAVLTLIAASLVVWVWDRPWSRSFGAIISSTRIHEVVVRAGLQPTGYFYEQITGLKGVEVTRPGCPAPVAILPVMAAYAEIAPDALIYRVGDYTVTYAYDGNLYSTRWISYRLGIMAIWRRLASLVSGTDSKSLYYYMKIWTPQGCQGLTPAEAELLRNAD